MADLQGQFTALLETLASPDNEARNRGEEQYNAISIEQRINLLLSAIDTSPQPHLRAFAAILLRRLLTNSWEVFAVSSEETQNAFKLKLLEILKRETDESGRKKICDTVSEVARNLQDGEGNTNWEELLKFMFYCCNSGTPQHKESALSILTSVPNLFGSAQENYLGLIKEMLFASLNDPDHPNVRFSAIRATCAFLTGLEEAEAKRHFSEFVKPMLKGVEDCVIAEDDDGPLKSFVELAEKMPKFLRPGVDQLIEFALRVIANTNFADNWRQLVLELVITICESAPAMIRKKEKYIAPLVVQMLQMMTDLEDEENWALEDEVEDVDSDENCVAAEAALDRLSCALGGKMVLPHIIQAVPPMLQSKEWKHRYAGLMAISASAEGCKKAMEAGLQDIVMACLPYIADEHPRVRFACCNALGQMATDFSPIFQKKMHDKVLPGLILLLDDDAHPRVQSHTAAALVNFFEECPQNVLLPYLHNLCQKMQSTLEKKTLELASTQRKLVLEQIITTIATIADTAEMHFTPFYTMFMPNLKYIMENANDKELRLLRGKTIECISLIGLAVGKEVFLSDAEQIMNMLLKAQTDDGEEMEADDPQVSYMISAWARMCKIIGPQFTAYLPVVMPPLLRAAQIKPEIALVDSDEQVDEDEGWEYVPLSDQQKFGVKTAGLEDKNTACQMLVCYARELKEGFSEYTEQVVKIMVPLLKFYFHDLIRSAAAESLPFLLESVKHKGDDYVREMWNYICPELFKSLQTEMEPDILAVVMESVAMCVEVLGVGFIDGLQMDELVEAMKNHLKKNYDKEEERKEARKDEDYDEEVEEGIEEELDQDDYLLGKIADIIHNLFGVYGEDFVQVFDKLTSYFVAMLAPERPSLEHQWAICVFDDLIDYAPNAAPKYEQHFLEPMMVYLSDSNPGVRQAAAYGVGALAIKFPGPSSHYAEFCKNCIPSLVNVISAPASREVENLSATENCISAITKIFKNVIGSENLDEGTLMTWMSWLPIQEDEEEGPNVYGFLMDLVEANNQFVMGKDNINLPDVIKILTEAIINKTICNEEAVLMSRITAFMTPLRENEALWSAILLQLPETHKVLLSGAP